LIIVILFELSVRGKPWHDYTKFPLEEVKLVSLVNTWFNGHDLWLDI